MRRLTEFALRLATVFALTVSLAAGRPEILGAQVAPGGGEGTCAFCQYNNVDLDNIIAYCPNNYTWGANYCEIAGPWCTMVGHCGSLGELHAFDVSLFGQMVVTKFDAAKPGTTRAQSAPRYLAAISESGIVPCKPTTAPSRIVAAGSVQAPSGVSTEPRN